jgi:hypothetical protein
LLRLEVGVEELLERPRLGLVNTFFVVYLQIAWEDFLVVRHILIV